ncbi:tRNA uracil 4-sulfurtransferase ThiI [Planctomycetota bacterium]
MNTATEKTDLVLVHYGEVALKKGNRARFEERLVGNLCSALRMYDGVRVQNHYGRIFIYFSQEVDLAPLRGVLGKIFGATSFSPTIHIPRDLDAMMASAVEHLQKQKFNTFVVRARRVDKDFPLKSPEINREVGAAVLQNIDCKVDLFTPDITLYFEVMHDRVLMYTEKIPGLRGLPVGVSGRVLSLVSGGIDSPVATLRMLQRGCTVALVHFHSAPYTDKASQEKVEEFAEMLTSYQRPVHCHYVALAPIQNAVVEHAQSIYRVLLYRRYMMRIAGRIAEKENASALVTGEALGQVASQTLPNMEVVAGATSMQILRPLLCFDKEEIIREARKYNTFELSIDEGQDCCSFMSTRKPALKARPRDLLGQEKILKEKTDINALFENAVEEAVFKIYK